MIVVGGNIYSIFKDGKQAHIVVQGTGCEKNEFIEVIVEYSEVNLKVGDQLWWHGRWAYWTPQNEGVEGEIRLKRFGLSAGVPREN